MSIIKQETLTRQRDRTLERGGETLHFSTEFLKLPEFEASVQGSICDVAGEDLYFRHFLANSNRISTLAALKQTMFTRQMISYIGVGGIVGKVRSHARTQDFLRMLSLAVWVYGRWE